MGLQEAVGNDGAIPKSYWVVMRPIDEAGCRPMASRRLRLDCYRLRSKKWWRRLIGCVAQCHEFSPSLFLKRSPFVRATFDWHLFVAAFSRDEISPSEGVFPCTASSSMLEDSGI